MAADYSRVKATMAQVSSTGIINLNQENFLSYKSRLNRRLKTAFGILAEDIQISGQGQRPHVRYGLRLPKDALLLAG